MQVAFAKLSAERHRFTVVRADGVRDAVELTTRSYLLHDWVHFAVETELPIADGFYGRLASGTRLSVLNDRARAPAPGSGLALAEALVGPMQSVYHGRLAVDAYLALVDRQRAPEVDGAFVARVNERLRRLAGRWRATAYGREMRLEWPAPVLTRWLPA
ncbi:MAG TPA: hypothetical protein VNN80_03420 [Polyangiaceae bacterium]|nr:hypothetical protein [Polyangiaceae bacterium]